MPVELALTLAGVICIFVSYWLINYLKEPKSRFTSQRGYAGHEKTTIEILLEDRFAKHNDDSRPQDGNTW